MNATLPSKLPVPVSLDDARIISISQADAFNTCLRKWLLGYVFQKQSKSMSRSLSIGVIFHDVVAHYYKAVMEGMSIHDAEQEGMKKLTEYYLSGEHNAEVLGIVAALFSRYVAQDTIVTSSRILAVEEDFFIPITADYWYGCRIDLLVEVTQGRRKGTVQLIDHKTTYDFKTPEALKLNPQMPKYTAAVRYNGYPVDEAHLNQIRTRFSLNVIPGKPDTDLFKLSPVGLNQERIKSSLKHQMVTSERIVKMTALPLELQIDQCTPNQNEMICKNCPFKDPCIMMDEGMSPEKALGANYVKKTSGFVLDSRGNSDG